jgi:hypothetical protein
MRRNKLHGRAAGPAISAKDGSAVPIAWMTGFPLKKLICDGVDALHLML